MQYIYYAGVGVAILLLLIRLIGNNKSFLLNASCVAIILFVMIYADNSKIDLLNYSYTYTRILQGASFTTADFGYYLLEKLGAILGLNFQQFKTLFIVASFALFLRAVKLMDGDLNIISICYISYFLFLDGEQLRNFLAFTIVLNAIPFLTKKNKNIKKYIITILIASLVHIMALVYLVFAFSESRAFIERIWKKLIIPYLLIMLLSIRYSNVVGGFLNSISRLFNESAAKKLLGYTATSTRLGFLFPTAVYTFFLMITVYAVKYFSMDISDYDRGGITIKLGNNRIMSSGGHDAQLRNSIVLLMLLGYMFLPLCVFNLTYYRLLRNITLLDVIFLSSCVKRCNQKQYRVIISIGLILSIFLWFIWDFHFFSDWQLFKECYLHIG